jgi:hypothetical protein
MNMNKHLWQAESFRQMYSRTAYRLSRWQALIKTYEDFIKNN